MNEFWNNLIANFSVRWTDIIDIALVSFLIYEVIRFIRETRAAQLVKGILILVVATYLSELCQLHALNYILKGILTLGAVALIIVFQPEMRRALEYIGRGKIFGVHRESMDKTRTKRIISAVTKAVTKFSDHRVGALIVFEKETQLSDIAENGTILNADITEDLLETIFYVGTPLHDGAIIIRGTKIFAAGCVLPINRDTGISRELGTRHRAAIGISENSDALVLVVSEETGIISTVQNGKMIRFLDSKAVEKTLLAFYRSEVKEEKAHADEGLKEFIKRAGHLAMHPELLGHHKEEKQVPKTRGPEKREFLNPEEEKLEELLNEEEDHE